MNMHVDFEIAKLLKEKRFDLPCRFLYKSEEEGWEEGIGVDYNWNYFESYSAPTIAETIMWLYEEHGIWIWVERYSTLFRPYAEEVMGMKNFFNWRKNKVQKIQCHNVGSFLKSPKFTNFTKGEHSFEFRNTNINVNKK